MYNKKYDRIYLFSPSLGTIEDCPFNDLPDDQVFDELSYDILDSVLEDIPAYLISEVERQRGDPILPRIPQSRCAGVQVCKPCNLVGGTL